MRTAVPLDLQVLASLECRKGIVGNYGDSAQRLELMRRLERIDRQRLLNARNFERGFVVVRFYFLPEYGRMFHGSKDHPRHGRVHPEDGFASDHLRDVEQRIIFFADVSPLGTLFQRKRNIFCARNWKFGCIGGNFAIAYLAAAGAMHYKVRFGGAFLQRNFPAISSRCH